MSVTARLSQRTTWAEGQPISELMSRALANPNLISLAAGFVDQQTLPSAPTKAALDAIFADDEESLAALQYGTTPGYPPLREALLDWIRREDGIDDSVSIDRVIVTAGSNQLLHLIGESLIDPGDIVLCAAPTYLVFLGTLGNIGARSIGVTSDEQGMIPDALEASLQQIEAKGELHRVKAIYVVPYFDNPCGITMPFERQAAIVDIAKQWSRDGKIHVIADAAYRELRYWGDDISSMHTCDEEHDTVVVAGTFSKCFSPGIRVGWGILPEHLVDPVCNQKGNIDFGSPNFSQHLMAKVLQLNLIESHVQQLRIGYRDKLNAMHDAMVEFLLPIPGVHWTKPDGGLYIWLELPDTINTGPTGLLFDTAVAEGVLYVPGQFCFPSEGEPVRHNSMRLSFGVQSGEKIREGIQALARAVERVRGER
ncbi:MAG: PLP-dependent aminotransferase family protein [Planctomycetes bacterium]|nr:PLP-dependent aminotransferase family protein [Planctomycetota bacterium]